MPHHFSRSYLSSWLFSVVTGTTCNVLLRDIVMELDVSFPRGYPYTDVVMVACDGRGEFCVVLRAVLFLWFFEFFYGLSFFLDFVIFLVGVRFVESWPVVLRLLGLHWLRHVLFSCEVGLIGPEARVLMSLVLGALVCM